MRPSYPAAWLLVLGALLTGCAGDAPDTAQPTAAASPTSGPTADPTQAPLDPRSPEALGNQVDFASVATTTPAQAQAVAAYEDFIRSFAIAQALPDAAYPPLLEAMGSDLEELVVAQLEGTVRDKEYIDGPYVERVLEVGTGPETVPMRVCSDISGRTVRDQTTGEAKPGGEVANSLLLITMRATPDGYDVVSVVVPPGDSAC